MAALSPDDRLSSARRLVVKIGSALLVDDSGRVRTGWLTDLADDIAQLVAGGTSVSIVSSGSIAIGRRRLGLGRRALRLQEKQAAAATGQGLLIEAYQSAFEPHRITVAQILLTPGDTEERRRHLNARDTLEALLRFGVLPIINENDTVTTQEIRYGDNDRLAARVAQMISADTLVLLSDVDGVYDKDPRNSADAVHIPDIGQITPEIEAMAGDAPIGYSSGGMRTKLMAAKIAQGAGCRMVIADGKRAHPLAALTNGARATWFAAENEPRTARKKWIGGAIKPAGTLEVDDGALKALKAGKSLLPAGVTGVEGRFQRGDTVQVRTADGSIVAHGLSAYSDGDARLIMKRRSAEIEALLGYRGRDEIIHRDDLVMLGGEG